MSSSIPVSIQQVEVDRILDLRHRVLRAGLPRDSAVFDGDHEATALHLAALDQWHCVVGCCTLLQRSWLDRPAWQLRGMAVETGRHRMGIGTRLLIEVECVVLDGSHSTQLWCNARKPAVRFYEKHGWKLASPEFDVPTAGPHHKMTRLASGRW